MFQLIPSKYSKANFEKAGSDPERLLQLNEELQRDVLRELHDGLAENMMRIVRKLNSVGHDLRPYTDPIPGDIAYRDDGTEGSRYWCNLRLGADLIVSVGYKDCIDE